MAGCKVIVVASQKGGCSKSMLTRCLAVAAELCGHGPVAVADTDPQGTTSKWYRRRVAETPVMLNIRSIESDLESAIAAADAAGVAYVFIDTQGALTDSLPEVAKHADFVIVPVRASPDDIDAIPDTLDVIQPLGVPFALVLVQIKLNALITGQARLNLSQFGIMCPAIMGDRVDYASAVTDGRTVLETDPNGLAAHEMREMWLYLHEQMQDAKKLNKRAKR